MDKVYFLALVVLCAILAIGRGHERRCKAPPKTVQHGKRSSLSTSYFNVGRSIRYWCYSGYVREGSRHLKCVSRNGEAVWQGHIPRCISM